MTTMETPKHQRSYAEISPTTLLSPTVTSRKEETDAMAHLNNRLAAYVDKVRHFETENSRLQEQIVSYQDTSKQEIQNIKAIYENELTETKRLLDELSKEKATMALDNQSLKENLESAKSSVSALTQGNQALESKLKSTTAMLQTERNTSATLLRERDQYKEELAALRAQLIDVQEELETHKNMLANETVARVDFENKLQSAREEIEFNKKIHSEELNEARKIHTFKVSEVDAQVKANYESKLEATVIDLREQHSMELEQMREDLENEYTSKIEALSKDLESAKGFEASQRTAEMKNQSLQKTIQQLQIQINNLTNRAQDLESDVQAERNLRISEVNAAVQERDAIKEKIAAIEKEYNELMDLKLKLDHEIGVYRKLLEEEEMRHPYTPPEPKKLNMSPSPMVPSAGSSKRRLKRGKRKRGADKSDDDTVAQKKPCGTEEVLHEAAAAGPEGTNNCMIM